MKLLTSPTFASFLKSGGTLPKRGWQKRDLKILRQNSYCLSGECFCFGSWNAMQPQACRWNIWWGCSHVWPPKWFAGANVREPYPCASLRLQDFFLVYMAKARFLPLLWNTRRLWVIWRGRDTWWDWQTYNSMLNGVIAQTSRHAHSDHQHKTIFLTVAGR